MPLSQPRTLYSVHSFTPYSRVTGKPYGTVRVLGGSSLAISGELVSLTGGSARYPWDVQDGAQTAELSLTPKEIPNFLFLLLLGKQPTETLSDPGSVSVLTNFYGTSLQDATTGIASVGVKSGSEEDLKFTQYTVEAASATTVNVYAASNVDFKGKTNPGEFEDDTLLITPTPLTITGSGGTTELVDYGVEFTGGSGVVAMTPGDTAKFTIYPESIEKISAKIGGDGDCIPEFGAIIHAQKKSDGSMWMIDCFRIKAQGYPFNMAEKAFNEAEITGQLIYDSSEDGICNIEYLKPTAGC